MSTQASPTVNTQQQQEHAPRRSLLVAFTRPTPGCAAEAVPLNDDRYLLPFWQASCWRRRVSSATRGTTWATFSSKT